MPKDFNPLDPLGLFEEKEPPKLARWENLLNKARESLAKLEELRRSNREEDHESAERLIIQAKYLSVTALRSCRTSPNTANVKCLEAASEVIATINHLEEGYHQSLQALFRKAIKECPSTKGDLGKLLED